MPEPRSVIEQRAKDAIDLPAELAAVEFKAGQAFSDLQYKITKTSMGMANLRDGGLIIIGVAQNEDRSFLVEGVSEASVATYVQETVYEFINRFASPPVELRVAPFEHVDKQFVVIAISPFERTPVVCRRNTPDGVAKSDQMYVGDFFVRTGDRVGTSIVTSAQMMSDLLELATSRRYSEMSRLQRESGVLTPPAVDAFDAEVNDVADLL
jgi:predicted HTH transcriptional regulator